MKPRDDGKTTEEVADAYAGEVIGKCVIPPIGRFASKLMHAMVRDAFLSGYLLAVVEHVDAPPSDNGAGSGS